MALSLTTVQLKRNVCVTKERETIKRGYNLEGRMHLDDIY